MRNFKKKSLIAIITFLIIILISCQKNNTAPEKYCTKIIDKILGAGIGYVFVVYDKQGNKMEIKVTATDFDQYNNGSILCLDKDYKIYR